MIFGRKTETQQQNSSRISFGNPNKREKTDKCEICTNKFSMMLKQHECKRCLRAVCFYCANNKNTIPSYDPKNVHRVCNICMTEMTLINSKKKNFQMTFGRNSIIGKKWLKYLLESDNIEEERLEKEFLEVVGRAMKKQNEKVKTLIQSELLPTLSEVKAVMNYSFYDTHVTYMSKENEDILSLKVTSVLTAFYEEFPLVLNKTLVGLILFLLYFCSESFTFKALQILHKDVIPTRFQYHKIKNTTIDMQAIESEVLVIQEMLKQTNQIDQNDFSQITPIIEFYIIQMLSSIFLNSLSFSCSFLIFDYFIKRKDFYELEKAFASLILLHAKNLKGMVVGDFQDYIVKATDYKKFQEIFTKEDKFKSSVLQLSVPTENSIQPHKQEVQETFQQQEQFEIIPEPRLEVTQTSSVSEYALLQKIYSLLLNDNTEQQGDQDDEINDSQKLYAEIQRRIQDIKERGIQLGKQFQEYQDISDSRIAQFQNKMDKNDNNDNERKLGLLLEEKQEEIEELKKQLFELENDKLQAQRGNKNLQSQQEKDEYYHHQINQLKSNMQQLEIKHKEAKNQIDEQKNKNVALQEQNIKMLNKNTDLTSQNNSLLKQLLDEQNLNKQLSVENQQLNEAIKIEIYKNQQPQTLQPTAQVEKEPFKSEDTYKRMLQNMNDEIVRRQREIYDLRIEKIQNKAELLKLQDNLEKCEIQKQQLKQQVENFEISQDVEKTKNQYEEIIKLMKETQIQQMNNLMQEFSKQD